MIAGNEETRASVRRRGLLPGRLRAAVLGTGPQVCNHARS